MRMRITFFSPSGRQARPVHVWGPAAVPMQACQCRGSLMGVVSRVLPWGTWGTLAQQPPGMFPEDPQCDPVEAAQGSRIEGYTSIYGNNRGSSVEAAQQLCHATGSQARVNRVARKNGLSGTLSFWTEGACRRLPGRLQRIAMSPRTHVMIS